MDLHASQIQAFSKKPADNLFAKTTIGDYIRRNLPTEDVVIVSPDGGGAKRYVTTTLQQLALFQQGADWTLGGCSNCRQTQSRSLSDP